VILVRPDLYGKRNQERWVALRRGAKAVQVGMVTPHYSSPPITTHHH
jgi:hypothetical protein